jgi:hypothetical protein
MEMAASSGHFFAMLTGGTLMVISKLRSDDGIAPAKAALRGVT